MKNVVIVLVHAFAGWALCAATMGIGMATTTLQTALIFVSFVIAMDFFLVALVINKSLDMFTSLLGTWIPFGLIFASTYLTGLLVERGPLNLREEVYIHR